MLGLFFSSENGFAQLGFCQGNSGDSIFTETFGTGTSDSPLPAGTTTYNYANGGEPNDGQYTVTSNTNYFDWFNAQDHTIDDTNGKMLLVNSASAAGEFYRTTINGLCENTSYEFSSWILNLTPANGFCGAGAIPVNVRFEIWDNTDTNLLALGDTGNIVATFSPNWQQYALVFQTIIGQTSVILKMINNGSGGCGNDLAIDDIVFKSCGDFIEVENTDSIDSVSLCSSSTPYNTTLTATPDNVVFSSHFYQWQESVDNITWVDIAGETNETLFVSGVTSTMFYRAKVAEYASNLNNNDCNTFSNVFDIIITQAPAQPEIDCWETALFNETSCDWEVSGTQPTQPTGLECWETATFNNSTCIWDVTGSQPTQPTGLECWETVSFNTTTCSWDILGTQPTQPTGLECWEVTIFNDTICSWEVSGTQPAEPINLECWQTTTFSDASCSWEISGEQSIGFEEAFFTICEGENLILQASTAINNATYLWDTDEITSSITVNTAGTYSVVTTDGCSAIEKTIVVEQSVIPILERIQSDGNNILVFTSNAGSFLYSLDGINYQTSNIFFDIIGGYYDVYIKSADCDVISIRPYIHFYIPKFMTPNDDGKNDTFKLDGLELYASSEVYIFDRFGKLLFSAKNSAVNWRGTYRNKPLPTSDYWYLIIIAGEEFRGHFTLKR